MDSDTTPAIVAKSTFEGKPFRCRVGFTRLSNPCVATQVSPKTNLVKGDIFVISLNEEGTQKLVMQVDRVDEERSFQNNHLEITIDETIKKTFSVLSFMTSYYMVQKVANIQPFVLYLLEVQVKEQYFSRGDMWRFARRLVNTTVYLKKTLDIFGMRATVYGLWTPEAPYRVSSGYVDKDTKIVFRSLSTCSLIFLQMSKEMWEFDHHGDTYYEKAVDGFLFDLFTRWKQMSCQHDVTMTLFSRVFYDAKSIDDFPKSLHTNINTDHRGRFYEDFYRVIYQNERYDEWLSRLAKIKQVLVNYKEDIVTYHKKQLPKAEADKMPTGTISSAADGNFLETVNLSSSVFERQFVDRAFDRLGQMSLVITPGSGVFEVDRELTNMTKQRVLDIGIGSDLVCLGEQPLFAVPLFKFFKEDINQADDYQIPHWMNLSYYHSATAPSCFKRYVPRLPFDKNRILGGSLDVKYIMNTPEDNSFANLQFSSMEFHDNAVFQTLGKSANEQTDRSIRIPKEGLRAPRRRNVTMGPTQAIPIEEEEDVPNQANGVMIANRKTALLAGINIDPRVYNINVKDDLALSTSHTTSVGQIGYLQYHNTYNNPASQILFYNPQSLSRCAQSAGTCFTDSNLFNRQPQRPKALTNPFAPASIRLPMVPGRRRWAHTFPIGPNKIPWHFHHLRQLEGQTKKEMVVSVGTCAHLVLPGTSKRLLNGFISKRINRHTKNNSDSTSRLKRIVSPSNVELKRESADRKESITDDSRPPMTGDNPRKPMTDSTNKQPAIRKEKKETIIWGPTGVEPWSAKMITGIDWKSLTMPASLPTTFDVAPTEAEIKRDYTQNFYELFANLPPVYECDLKKKPQHPSSGNQEKNYPVDPMERQKTAFDELIDQRLSQGFQMIPEIPTHIEKSILSNIRRVNFKPTEYNRLLSIGRIYHTLSLVTEDNQNADTVIVCVQQFKPQYAFQPKSVDYKYRFQCPDSSSYDPAEFKLNLESLEAFPWNIVDNIVCSHGTGDHKLADTMKYYRARLVVVPVSRDYTVKSIESGQTKCDSRQEMSPEDFFLYVEHFIRFLFMLNKLNRPNNSGTPEFTHRPLDPKTGLKRVDHPKRQVKNSVLFKTFKLADMTSGNPMAIDSLLNLLRDDQQGLFFVADVVLPKCSFIAIEAIWWAIEHGEDVCDEKAALSLFQLLFELGFIRHCTQHTKKSFRFGFFLYYIVTENTKNYRLEFDDYAEVEFHQTQRFIPSMDYLGFARCKPMRLLPKTIVNQQTTSRTTRLATTAASGSLSSFNLTDIMEDLTSTKQETPSIAIRHYCNVDVDTKHASDRREWATAQYHAFYNPHCLFELEIHWLVVTSCILGDLIFNWSTRTGTMLSSSQIAFHLIPIPSDPFAEFDPLRGPIYVKLDSACLLDQMTEFSKADQDIRLNIFQELILKRYGFMLNSCVSYKEENIYYVHISGGMLVYIISDVYNTHRKNQPKRVASSAVADEESSPHKCGFFWCWNFCLGKRWRTTQTGEEKYQDIMLADFRAFCANDKNRLLNFWNEANDLATAKMREAQDTSADDGDEQTSASLNC